MTTTRTMEMRGRPVTHEEALESAQRLINSHFHQEPRAHCSIPARTNDDDIVVTDYILERQAADILNQPCGACGEPVHEHSNGGWDCPRDKAKQ